MKLGTLVVAGESYPITSIRLREGKIWFTAEGNGPSPAWHDEPITIFGEDGAGIGQGGIVSKVKAGKRDRVVIRADLRLLTLEDA